MPEEVLRTAFQRQKKKFFNQSSLEKKNKGYTTKENERRRNETSQAFVEENFFLNCNSCI